VNNLWLIPSLVSAVLFGASDFTGGLAARRAPALPVTIAAYALSVPCMLAIVLASGEPAPVAASLAWSALAGATEIGGSVTFYIALAAGPIGIVAPLVAVIAAGLPVAVGVLAGDPMNALRISGIAFGLLAIVLVARPSVSRSMRRRTLIVATVSGCLFAAAWLAFHGSQMDAAAVIWPIAIIRIAGLCTGLAVALGTRAAVLPPRSVWRPVVLLAALDSGAAAALLVAYRTGPLGPVAVVTSMYTVVTVVLGLGLLRERPARVELLGAGAALLAIAFLAA
jgi:drug/metabolite transporter (DMT)-like permease